MAQPVAAQILSPSATTEETLQERVERLDSHKDEWASLPLTEKIGMARRLLERMAAVAEPQVQAAARAKSIPLDSPVVGEEWLGGPAVSIRTLRLLIETLEDIQSTGLPRIAPSSVHTRADGQTVVDVFPTSTWDRLLFFGFSAQIWMQEGVTPENLHENMAQFYRRPDPEGKVSLVLGAGNVASIGPLDVVYKLFVEGQVSILKMNPVNDYLGPFIEEAFSEFIDRGFMDMAYGGADVGAFLCQHELVDEIHITGSHYTHNAIVYGPGEEGEKRRKADKPIIDKRITSELGNVSPVIIVPGQWSDGDMRFHAENLASQIANNAGFNCNAARVIITHRGWRQREQFLNHLRDVLAEIAPRKAYYPGAEVRFDKFLAQGDSAESFGPHGEGYLPWTVLFDVDPDDEDHIGFSTEAFCGVKVETALEARDTDEFLQKASAFCNDRVWGTLSASLIIDPTTARKHAEALDGAVADLRYGSVVVNHWPALSYGLGSTSWGAFPGHTFQDIQSGIGVVHNTFLFDKPEKSVIYGPFRVFPKPPWFVTNKNTDQIGMRLVDFEQSPRFLAFLRLVKESMGG